MQGDPPSQELARTLNLQGECLLKSVPSGVPPLPRPQPSHVQEH